MLNKLLFIPIITGALLVSGCAHKISFKPIKTRLDIPAETFQCAQPTTRPKGDKILESEVARYINSLEFSQKDCLTRLKEVQVLIMCSNESDCNPNVLIELLRVANPESSQ